MPSHQLTSTTGGCPGPGWTSPVLHERGSRAGDHPAYGQPQCSGTHSQKMEWQLLVGEHPTSLKTCKEVLRIRVLSSSRGGVSGQSGTTRPNGGFSHQRQVPGCGDMRQMGKTFSETDHHAPGQLPPVCMRVPYH